MIDYSEIFFLNGIPFHMFFSVQILAAEMLFAFHMRKHVMRWKRLAVIALAFLTICYFHPMLGHRYIRVLAIFLESLLVVAFGFQVPINSVFFIGAVAYAVQNLANQIGTLANQYLNIKEGGLEYFLVATVVYAVVYIQCYRAFIAHFPENGKIYIGNKGCYLLTIATLIIVYLRSIYIHSVEAFGEREFMVVSIIMVLYLQFSALQWRDAEEQKHIIQNLLQQQKEQQEMRRENIDIINMKCHDLRYHIAEYRKNNQLSAHDQFFDEVEKAVEIYDSTACTGNAALDTLLSEKLLYSSANHISLSYMVDVEAIAFMETSDVYSLFGNAVDNAIQSVMGEDESHRIISILVRKQKMCTQIIISNYCRQPPAFVDGLPETKGDKSVHGFGVRSIRYIVEKYDGSLVIDSSGNSFTLSILFPPDVQISQ